MAPLPLQGGALPVILGAPSGVMVALTPSSVFLMQIFQIFSTVPVLPSIQLVVTSPTDGVLRETKPQNACIFL